MQPVWLAIGVVLVAAFLFAAFQSRWRGRHKFDLGVISDQWMAQHRASTHDRHR